MGADARPYTAWVLVGAALLAACSPTAPSGPGLPVTRANEVLALAQLPPEIKLATSMAARDCMIAHGHRVPYDATIQGREYNVVAGVVGVHSDREAAARSGYDSTLEPVVGGIEGFIASLPEPQRDAAEGDYWGPPDEVVTVNDAWGEGGSMRAGGCFAQGQKAVFGSLEDALRVLNVPNALRTMSGGSSARRNEALKSVLPAYEKCMRAAGYPVRGLRAEELAKEKFGSYRKPGSPPSNDEVRMITSDIDCQAQAQVREKLVEAWGHDAAEWVLTHEAEIAGMQELIKASTERAKKIIDR